MGDSTYIHSAHNVSNLLYHIVTPTKYRRMALTREVEGCLREICEGIELRWDWVRFLEVGTDGDHVHYLVQSTPDHSPAEIVRLIKGMTAKRIFAEHPEVKRMLWGGEFWSDGFSCPPSESSQARMQYRSMCEAKARRRTTSSFG